METDVQIRLFGVGNPIRVGERDGHKGRGSCTLILLQQKLQPLSHISGGPCSVETADEVLGTNRKGPIRKNIYPLAGLGMYLHRPSTDRRLSVRSRHGASLFCTTISSHSFIVAVAAYQFGVPSPK